MLICEQDLFKGGGQDYHVGDFSHFQTGALLLVEGDPAGVVGITSSVPAVRFHLASTGILHRQSIAHIDNPSAILHQIPVNTILRITGQDASFVKFSWDPPET